VVVIEKWLRINRWVCVVVMWSDSNPCPTIVKVLMKKGLLGLKEASFGCLSD